ncbi:MAG: hypothetical protein MEEGG_00720 [Eggerthella lenta]
MSASRARALNVADGTARQMISRRRHAPFHSWSSGDRGGSGARLSARSGSRCDGGIGQQRRRRMGWRKRLRQGPVTLMAPDLAERLHANLRERQRVLAGCQTKPSLNAHRARCRHPDRAIGGRTSSWTLPGTGLRSRSARAVRDGSRRPTASFGPRERGRGRHRRVYEQGDHARLPSPRRPASARRVDRRPKRLSAQTGAAAAPASPPT